MDIKNVRVIKTISLFIEDQGTTKSIPVAEDNADFAELKRQYAALNEEERDGLDPELKVVFDQDGE